MWILFYLLSPLGTSPSAYCTKLLFGPVIALDKTRLLKTMTGNCFEPKSRDQIDDAPKRHLSTGITSVSFNFMPYREVEKSCES